MLSLPRWLLFPFHCAYQCLFTWPSLKLFTGQTQKWVWVSDVTSDVSSDASYCSCSSCFEYYQVFCHRDSLFIHDQAVAKSSNFTLQISTHCKRAISLETARNVEQLQKITKIFPELWALRGRESGPALIGLTCPYHLFTFPTTLYSVCVLLPNVALLTGPDVYFSFPYLNCSTIRL